VRSCCEGVLDEKSQAMLIDAAWSIAHLRNAGRLMEIINELP
jgi:hypothetical protein